MNVPTRALPGEPLLLGDILRQRMEALLGAESRGGGEPKAEGLERLKVQAPEVSVDIEPHESPGPLGPPATRDPSQLPSVWSRASEVLESGDHGAGGSRPGARRHEHDVVRPEAERAPEGAPNQAPGRGRPAALLRKSLAFGREHLVVVAIIALAGFLWAGLSMTQARSVPVTVTSPTAAPQVSVTPTATPAAVLVHVMGAVRSPGVVRLTLGARIQDAIAAADGYLDTARPGDLNLAAVVSDGSQIVIGTAADPGGEVRGTADAAATTAGGTASGLINLNTATLGQLDTLPGVGPVTAQAILDWRTKHERFTKVAELQEVDGIGPKTYAQLAPKVTV